MDGGQKGNLNIQEPLLNIGWKNKNLQTSVQTHLWRPYLFKPLHFLQSTKGLLEKAKMDRAEAKDVDGQIVDHFLEKDFGIQNRELEFLGG